MFRILLAEDDTNLKILLTRKLELKGFIVKSCTNGVEAIELFKKEHFDLLISDVMMPQMDGNELIQSIRSLRREFPIIMLTALDHISDKKKSFERGADDYLTKPVNIDELEMRVTALLRRYNLVNAKSINHKNLTVDYNRFCVINSGKEITLAKKEFLLFYKLFSNPGHIYSREELLAEIWGIDSYSIDRTIDVHVNKIREKIVSSDFEIQAVRGLGYKVVLK